MNSVIAKFVCLFALLSSSLTIANEEQADIGAWSIGVNLGIGQRSAFITGQDALDIHVLPSFYYYGEHWFLDNGTLGYTFEQQEDYAFSFIGEVNPYGLYFEQSAFGESFNSLYLLSPNSVSGEGTDGSSEDLKGLVTTDPSDPSVGTPVDPSTGPNLSPYNLPKPSLSLDAGIQGNWFLSDTQEITAKLVKDISNKHSGLRAKFNWSVLQQINETRIKFNLGFDWLDTKASNYYFGLEPENSSFSAIQYELGNTINPFVSVSANLPLSDNLSLVAHVKYLKLDSAIADSPIVDKDYSVTHFAGIHYKFW